MADTVGSIEYIARIDTAQLRRDAQEVDSTVKNLGNNSVKDTDRMNEGFKTLSKVGIAGVTAAAIGASFAIIKNLGNAVERVDTLNNFPRVLTAMGATASDATGATNKLSKTLEGLPTSLQEGAKGVQSLVAAGLPVPRATDAFLAMNDALIAAGGNSQDTQIVMESLTRAISAGSVDASTMQAAMSRMPTVMQALSKETGKSAGELFNLYSQDPQKLLDDMIRLDKTGSGSMQSLQTQARAATDGVGTSFTNMNTAITRGLAAVITAMQPGLTNSIMAVGQGFEGMFKTIASIISFFKQHETASILLAGALAGVATAIFVAMIPAMVGLALAIGSAVLAAAPFILVGMVIAGLALIVYKNWEPISGFFVGLWSSIVGAINGAMRSIAGAINGAVSIIGSLPGRAMGAIGNLGGLLVGSGKALIQGFVDGIKSMINAVANAAKSAVSAARDFFPFSPAKKGPFSGKGWTAYSGAALMQGMAQGITSNVGLVSSALNGMGVPTLSPSGVSVGGISAMSEAGPSVVNNIGTINISSDVDGERLLKRLGRDDEITAQGVVA